MKKSIFSKVGAAAVVLTLVTASLVGGTFAKYTSNVNGTAKATAATWAVKFEAGGSEFIANKEIALVPTSTAGRADGKIVPGDSGELSFKVDGTGSDVGFDYTIKITPKSGTKNDIKFFQADGTTELVDNGYTGTVYYSTTDSMSETQKIVWKLPEATTEEISADVCEYDIVLTAVQSTATKPAE